MKYKYNTNSTYYLLILNRYFSIMKRGRRSLREQVKSLILDILSNTQTPLTISSIKKLISKKFNKNFSWNTIQKYLDELVEAGQVVVKSLPHSKNKDKIGIVVYILKR
ncbi:MAG: hypothetical protein QXY79_02175 [Candidatus Methanomethylicia archaeon]